MVCIALKEENINFTLKQSFLWYFDEEAYASNMNAMLKQPQLAIDDTSTDDTITGTLKTSKSSQTILTTIPYDKGWNVYVDGEKIETYESLDALLTFDVSGAGEHTVKLEYMPAVYKLGITVSIIAIIAFLFICAADFVLKRTLFKNLALTRVDDLWLTEDDELPSLPYSNDTTSSENDSKEENDLTTEE